MDLVVVVNPFVFTFAYIGECHDVTAVFEVRAGICDPHLDFRDVDVGCHRWQCCECRFVVVAEILAEEEVPVLFIINSFEFETLSKCATADSDVLRLTILI